MSNRKRRTLGRKRRARCPICESVDLAGKGMDDKIYTVCMECGHYWEAE